MDAIVNQLYFNQEKKCFNSHSELSAGKDSFHSGSEPVSVKRAKEDFVTVAGSRTKSVKQVLNRFRLTSEHNCF